MESLIRKPSAWVPLVLSFWILAMEFYFLVTVGPPQREPDEGVAAHLFQLWIVAEFFLVIFFAARWLPSKRWPAFRILIMQIVLVLAGMFPVFYFHLQNYRA